MVHGDLSLMRIVGKFGGHTAVLVNNEDVTADKSEAEVKGRHATLHYSNTWVTQNSGRTSEKGKQKGAGWGSNGEIVVVREGG